MSQARNLLNNLSLTANIAEISTTPINDILSIDAEGRFTNIPNNEILFGVETDKDVERKHFRCPRIVGDNIDLSELQLIIKYKNANDEIDRYMVTDEIVNDEYIDFSWLLGEKVLVKHGVVYFAIQGVRTESDGSVKNCWNTTLASGKVLDTLLLDDFEHISEAVEEEARDVLAQLLQSMDDKYAECIQNITAESNRQISRIQSAGSTQVQAIEQKGSEILDSIPDPTEQLAEIEAAGNAQVQHITNKGAEVTSEISASGESQLAAIEAKGAEVIALIESLNASQIANQIDELNGLIGGGI